MSRTLSRKWSQNFNFYGIVAALRVFLFPRHRSLCIPHLRLQKLAEINFCFLKAHGFEGVIFDKDGTLTPPYSHKLYENAKEPFQECVNAFGSDRVVVLSNSEGMESFDHNFEGAKRLEASLGVHVLRHSQKKPQGIESVHNYFRCDTKHIVCIGDRLLTDIYFGNSNGMFTIYVKPPGKETSRDPFVVAKLRQMEQYRVETWSKSYAPPEHPLLPHAEIELAKKVLE